MRLTSYHRQSGGPEVKYLVILLFNRRVLLHLFPTSSRTIWMAPWEMFPLLYAFSQPTLLFQHLIHLNGFSFLFPQSLRVQTHDRILRYGRGGGVVVRKYLLPNFPFLIQISHTKHELPGSKLTCLCGFHTRWMGTHLLLANRVNGWARDSYGNITSNSCR